MTNHRSQVSRPARALGMLLAVLASASVLAVNKGGSLDPKALYQRDSAACSGIRDPDARANCLSEASTRYASTKPTLPEERDEVLMRNALRRCEPLPEVQRNDCVARMQGHGTTSGSVAGGGIYRELVTVTREVGVPEAPPSQAVMTPVPAQ